MNPWIVCDADTLGGRPRVRGTRLSVAFLIELVASGGTRDEILSTYPQLSAEGLHAALEYAASALRDEVIWLTRVPA